MSSAQPLLTTRPEVQTDNKVATEKLWKVVVWNDPVTPMPVVTLVFKKIFGYPQAKAEQLMMTVHHEGRAIVWSGGQDRAEHYVVQLHVHGLLATMESDD